MSSRILGFDEVGRGSWAGPLVVGAVLINDSTASWCEPLADSKQLTKSKREALAPIILENAAAVGLGWVSPLEIDYIGLGPALHLASRRALAKISAPFDEIIIDGTSNFLAETPLKDRVTVLKKADSLIKSVSAASIVAKVARDEYMRDIASDYPDYGFADNVGYGTKTHREALAKFGPTDIHRYSYKPIAETLQGKAQLLLARGASAKESVASRAGHEAYSNGHTAELAVSNYLKNNGHTILTLNHKTKFYEIDIISIKDDHLYFTEVKYRKNSSHGSAFTMITKKKQQQMRFAAEAFLKYQPSLKTLHPQLAAAVVEGEEFAVKSWLPLK
jgi:ribonuclease HII